MGILQTGLTELLKQDASFTPVEQMLISPGLERYFANAKPKDIERINNLLSPVMLFGGLSIWLGRNLKQAKERHDSEQSKSATNHATKQAPETNHKEPEAEAYKAMKPDNSINELLEHDWNGES